jgi:hypothetical protein
MHIDARQLDNQSVIEGDICIIGAGAAGISIALEWENTPYKVTAVIKDMPVNSHIRFDFFFSMDNVRYQWGSYLSNNFYTYIVLKEGVYVGVTGPTFETRAEYKMLNLLGGDAVGMSTVQEVIAAVHLGLPVFAMSVITDIGIRKEENTITHEDVLRAARDAEPKLTLIFKELIARL